MDKLKEFMTEFAALKRVCKAAENYVAACRACVGVTEDNFEPAYRRQDEAYEIMQQRVDEYQKAFGHPADMADWRAAK